MKDLSLKAKLYILGTILLGWALSVYNLLQLPTNEYLWLVILSLLASLALLFKVEGSTERSHYSINFMVYAFTFVLFDAPEAILVILVSNLVEWAWHKYPWYIQTFNITSYVIIIQAADITYKWINPTDTLETWNGVVAIMVAMGFFTLLNHLMIGLVVWLARGQNFVQSGIFDLLPLMIDYTLLCMGAGVALVWTFNPWAVPLVIIPLYLIYTTLRVPALERQTEIDQKTGLFNHRYFERALENELNRANRFERPLTVVMGDLDLLRNINNVYGHLAGDEALKCVANILVSSLREYDIVARFGGEEFSILLPETTPQEAYPRVEDMRKAIQEAEIQVSSSITPIKITMSFGIAGRDNAELTDKEILHNADAALYHSKLKGRNRTYLYTAEAENSFITPPSQDYYREHDPLAVDTIQEITILEDKSISANENISSELLQCGSNNDKQEKMPDPHQEKIAEGSPKIASKPGPHWQINLYISLLAVCAGLYFFLLFQSQLDFDLPGLILFALIVMLTEWFSIDIYARNIAVSTSAVPLIASVLLFGPLGALISSLAFAITAKIKHRSPISRLVFNTSNQLLAGLMCITVIQIIGTPFKDWPQIFQILLTITFAELFFLITTTNIAFGMGMDTGIPARLVWKEQFGWLAPHYAGLGLIAFGLIFSYKTAGILGTIVILVPILLLRMSQKQYIDRTRFAVNALKEKNLILEKNAEEISILSDGLLDTLSEVIDLRDPYVLGHSRQVTRYAVIMARELHLMPSQVETIRKASLLHDIGKIGIPDGILLKPDKLNREEFDMIKKHVTLGTEILQKSPSLHSLIPIIRHHHERYDGRGYPDQLMGDDIPFEARIVAVADAIEAMASDRPYRKARNTEEIIQELKLCSGTQFDPDVVNAFIRVVHSEGRSMVVNSAISKREHIRELLPELGTLIPLRAKS